MRMLVWLWAKKIREISEFPLLFQPGTRWHYSLATDVCGYLVQILSGIPFDTYLQENIFEPLGMVDTAFHVSEKNVPRFATLYAHNADDSTLQLHQDEGILRRNYLVPTKSPSGGHGLVSTTEDYWRFVQMLLNQGELEGARLLGRKTIEFISSNHVSLDIIPTDELVGMGFGLGFAVINNPAQTGAINSIGTYWWGGAAATGFWIDPQEELVAVIMTQIRDGILPLWDDLRSTTYQAVID
jgi:CubicO group peptidase (beta-lactamase class C family)